MTILTEQNRTEQNRTEQNRTEQNNHCHSFRSCQVVVIGCMDHTIDHTFESANRVYDVMGICPTIPTCAGGNIQPKILVTAG